MPLYSSNHSFSPINTGFLKSSLILSQQTNTNIELKIMHKLKLLLSFGVFISLPTLANDQPNVKLSSSGICHDNTSAFYNRTRNFKSYPSIASCLAAGGRSPKASKKNDRATDDSDHFYSRSKFGAGWLDLDHDCQDSRQEILIAQNVGSLHFRDAKQCWVGQGKWISVFTGQVHYNASSLDIDHICPLSFAWQHGADKWSQEKREQFANDPTNLVAVEASLNRQKKDADIANWLPPKNQCQYISRFLRVSKSYDLQFSAQEQASYQQIKSQYCK